MCRPQLDLELAEDDAGDVEHVVDEPLLELRAVLDHMQRLAQFLGRVVAGAEELHPAENRGHRRAELVRKRGQEVVFGAILGLGFAIAPLVFGGRGGGAFFGDVAERDHRSDRAAVFIVHRRGAELDRETGAVIAKKCVRHLVAHAVAMQRDVERAVADVAGGHARKRRMKQRMNLVADHVPSIAADHARRGGIDERGLAVEVHAEHAFDGRVEDQFILPAETRQLLCLSCDGLRLPEQLHEDIDFVAEDLRLVRLEDVVDRAELVAAEDVSLAAAERRQKDDGCAARFVALANQRRRFEAIEVRHLHIEQDDCELALEQRTQRGAAGIGTHEVQIHIGQDRFEREQIAGLVVDQKDVHLLLGDSSHEWLTVGWQTSVRNGAMFSRRKIRST